MIAKVTGTDPSLPRAMIFGHMDQLGFIVRKVEEDGFIQVDRLGGIPEKVLPGLELVIRSEDGKWHPGVFGPKAHHATPAEEKYKVDLVTSLFIDVGASSAQEVHGMGSMSVARWSISLPSRSCAATRSRAPPWTTGAPARRWLRLPDSSRRLRPAVTCIWWGRSGRSSISAAP